MTGFLILAAILLFAVASVLAPAWAARKGQKTFVLAVAVACALPVFLMIYAVWFHQRLAECIDAGEETRIPEGCESAGDLGVYLGGYLGTFLLGAVLISSLIADRRARRARGVKTISSVAS